MQEYLYYDSTVNGSMRTIVPGKLLALLCPAELPGGAWWADLDGGRRFSAGYFADLQGDFDVKMVVRCCGAAYDPRAFEQMSIGVEDLLFECAATPAACPQMLRAVDRFIILMRLSPGAIALHGTGPDGSLGPAGWLLVEACLIRLHCFDGAAAMAWVLMAYPPPAARATFLLGIEETVDWRLFGRPASTSSSVSPAGGTRSRKYSARLRRRRRRRRRERDLGGPSRGSCRAADRCRCLRARARMGDPLSLRSQPPGCHPLAR